MSDDYLWDGSGPPDPTVQKLEQQLSPLSVIAPLRPRTSHWKAALAIAAALCVIWGALYAVRPLRPSEWKPTSGGGFSVGAKVITGPGKQLTLQSENTGRIILGPDSELHLPASNDRQQLSLTKGEMHAFIWAPPGNFVVDTPSSKTIDLGCQYTLTVAPDGSGFLTVESGWVALQTGAHESFIPAGASCHTSRKEGPSIPYYQDAPEAFQSAVADYSKNASDAAVEAVLDRARPRDAFTLWHLLGRVNRDQEQRVSRRLCELKPATCGQEREAAWNALGLGGMTFWREWKRTWK